MYGKAFFDLQLQFAQTVSILSGLPLARAVLEYTNLYIRLGCGRDFDPAHPRWKAYVAGLRDPTDAGEWTYRFYRDAAEVMTAPPVVATSGCFSYGRLSDDRIRLHFHNAETDGHSPLDMARRGQRLADLAALFAHAKRTARPPLRVVGASWLYNLEAYRSLFPTSYLETAQVIHHRFQHMPLWGQFVNRHGGIRASVAFHFRDRLGRQSSLEGLDQCFPLQEAPALDFYEFYGV